MPRLHHDDYDDANERAGAIDRRYRRERIAARSASRRPDVSGPQRRSKRHRTPRTAADQAFKCGRCRAFIGAPVVGSRHRNHCPMCLTSRHVDGKRPGDRRSDCGSLMAPVGVIQRRNGEQLILHRCLGCGHERPNRVAADDNPTLLLRLPPVSVAGNAEPATEEAIA